MFVRALFFILSLLLAPLTHASDLPIAPSDCERELNGTSTQLTAKHPGYAKIAREMGIEFLMMPILPPQFSELLEAQHDQGSLMLDAKRGFIDDPKPGSRDSFNHAMKPLFRQDQGRWAHQLVGNGNDSIGMGVRYKRAEDWSIGILFPVEILDYYDFNLSNHYGPGRGPQISADDFRKQLLEQTMEDQEMRSRPGKDWYDVNDHLRFYFSDEIPASLALMLWMPAPLVQEFVPGDLSQYPGMNSQHMPPRGTAFSMRLATLKPGTEHDWHHPAPPKENTMEFFNPEESLGTWFNTVPDWSIVKAQLALRPKRARPFLPYDPTKIK